MSEPAAPQDNDTPFSDCEHRLQIVQGYYELGMYDDALSELEDIENTFEATPDCLQMRILLLIKRKEWKQAWDLSKELRKIDPQGCAGYIHGAYCLHELNRTDEALALLQEGPDSLQNEAIYFYNMGCYEAALGDVEDARKCLHRSFDLDKRLVAMARKDPDLHAIKDTL